MPLEKKEDFFKAFSKAAGATGLVKAMFASLISGSAYEGTEDTGEPGSLDSKGGKLMIIHPHERIVKEAHNKKLNGMSNDELINNALMFDRMYKTQFDTANATSTLAPNYSHDARMTTVLQTEIRQLREVLESKPVSSANLGRLGEWSEAVERKGIKNIIHHKKQSTRPSLRLNG